MKMNRSFESRRHGAARASVMNGQNLDVLMVVTTVDVLVLDPQIGK
jgi:hypothetical protein